jgi:hypothetical protein
VGERWRAKRDGEGAGTNAEVADLPIVGEMPGRAEGALSRQRFHGSFRHRKSHYIALIHKEADSGYRVSFPDVPGVTTDADTA